MTTKVIEVLIVREPVEGVIDCQRVEQPESAPSIRVDWNNTEPPAGFQAIGDGVAFYEARDFRGVVSTTGAKLNPAGAGSFTWRDTEHVGLLTLIVIFPPKVGLKVESLNPAPKGAKIFSGKLAVYWELTKEQQLVAWEQITDTDSGRLRDIVAKINKEEHEKRERKDKEIPSDWENKSLDPFSVFIASLSRVPGLRILFGVVSVLAILAITRVWSLDRGWTIIGGIAVVFFAFLLLALSKFSALEGSDFRGPAKVLLYFCVFLFMTWCSLLTLCVFFKWPISVQMLPLRPVINDSEGVRVEPVINDLKGVRVEFLGMYAVGSSNWPAGKQVQLTLNWSFLEGMETNRLGGITNHSVNPSVTLPKDGQLPGFRTANFIVPLPGELTITNLAKLSKNIRILVHAEFHGAGRAQSSDPNIYVPLGEVVEKLQKGSASEIVTSDRMQVQPGDTSELTHVYAVKISPIQ